MKARIKKTGEIVEVVKYSKHNHCIEYGNSFGEYDTKSLDDVDLILDEPTIDWEQRRYEIAKDVMAGIISNEEQAAYARVEAKYEKGEIHTIPKAISRYAIALADGLIEELKKDKQG